MASKKLKSKEIEAALEKLNGWKLKKGVLEKSFMFTNFNEAFAFLTRTALYSEKVNHHAEYSGVYNKLKLKLSTHDAGGITQKDIDFAKETDSYLTS